MPSRDVIVIWDMEDDPDGNVAHILELHDVTVEDVDEVLGDPASYGGVSRSTARPMAFGWTSSGRYVGVVYEEVDEDPFTVYPVTAYLANPPRPKR